MIALLHDERMAAKRLICTRSAVQRALPLVFFVGFGYKVFSNSAPSVPTPIGGQLINEHCRFQLEATKLGRDVVFQVTVLEKRERRGTKLYAETECSDPYHFLIQFIIREAESFEEVLDKFKRQLVYRGFSPLRFRVRTHDKTTGYDRWAEWVNIDINEYPDFGPAGREPLR
ncbi:MAG: hypothetical protein HUU55_03320 [Myxococcales bacterium]|nr:hypothetical protein [Myxococcales bacterium]